MKGLETALLSHILDSIPDAVFIIDANHKVVAWNKTIQNISKVPREEILGKDSSLCAANFYGQPGLVLADLVLEPALEAQFNKPFRREGNDLYIEGHINITSSGESVYYWAKASPIFDQNGNIIAAIEILRDTSFVVELGYNSRAAAEQAEAAFQQLMAAEEELRQQYEALQKTEQQLRKQLDFNKAMIDNMNELFYTFDQDIRLTFINKKCFDILGYRPEELIGTFRTRELFPDEDWEWIKKEIDRRLTTGDRSSYVLPVRHRDGSKKYLKINSAALKENGRIVGGLVLADDITEDIKAREALRVSESNLRRITDNVLDLVSELDASGNLVYVSPSHFKVLGYPVEVMKKMMFIDFVHPDDMRGIRHALKNMLITGEPATRHLRCRHAEGHYIWTETLGNPIIQDGKVTGVILSSRDITERIQLERELHYLSVHDSLTNLYNRPYFEEEMTRLDATGVNPVGVMTFDLDGLKLVNDTLGVEAGDRLLIKSAQILQNCFKTEIVARIGGDEFAVLLPYMDKGSLEDISASIQEKITEFNNSHPQLPLSLSIGMAVREDPAISLRDTFKEADDYMNRIKLHRSRSAKSAVVYTLLKALEARDFITEGHGERMQDLVVLLGRGLGLADSVLTTLQLLAQFHDIGKVGVPDRILFKEDKLTPEENLEMQRHSEIGQRIALASPELSPLADLILKHHEWWNGQGYPLGLSGEDIPLECRVLALADAYDAMTNDRPYRKAMSHEEAKAEILRCSGTQFEPRLADLFLKLLEE